MDDDAGDGVGSGLAGKSGELDVLESVIGEFRRPCFPGGIALQGVGVHRAGAAEVLGAEPAVVVKHLGVADGDLVSGLAFDLEADDAGDVLAEIEDEDAGFVFGDGFGFDFLDGADRHAGMGLDLRVGAGLANSGLPLRIVEAGRGPAGHFLAGVVGLAHQDVALGDRAERGFPRGVGDDGFAAAVGPFQFELEADGGRNAIVISAVDACDQPFLAGEQAVGDISGIPAVGQGRADGVVAFADQPGDIVGLAVDPFLIGRPTRSESFIGNPLAVDFHGVNPEGGGVESRPDNGRSPEFLPEVFRGREVKRAAVGIADEILDVLGGGEGVVVLRADPRARSNPPASAGRRRTWPARSSPKRGPRHPRHGRARRSGRGIAVSSRGPFDLRCGAHRNSCPWTRARVFRNRRTHAPLGSRRRTGRDRVHRRRWLSISTRSAGGSWRPPWGRHGIRSGDPWGRCRRPGVEPRES